MKLWQLFLTVIVITCGVSFAASQTGAPAQGWGTSPPGVVKVSDFGAVGDGVHDDAPAIQAAMDAVAKTGHGIVVFEPFGVYRTGAALNLSGVGQFEIDGRGATLKPTNELTIISQTAKGDTLFVQHCSKFQIRDLSFDGNRSARGAKETAVSLRLFDCSDFRIVRCTFTDAICDHLYFAASDSLRDATACRDGVVENCLFDGAWRNAISVIHAHNLVLHNNTIRNVVGTRPQSGIDIEANTTGSNADCDRANRDISISGNSFSSCTGSAVQIPGVKSPSRISIVGNNIAGSGVSVPDDVGASEIAICDNVIHDVVGVGIAIGGVGGVVSGNRLSNGSEFAIYVTGGQHLISRNSLVDFGRKSDGRCITVSYHSSDASVIEGNIVRKAMPNRKWVAIVHNPKDVLHLNYQFGVGESDGVAK
jgi:hypothetical protein